LPEAYFQEIDRSVLDATLYGISTGLAYLGPASQVLQEEMGNMMLQYLIGAGAVKYEGDLEDFRIVLTNLLTKNGFGKDVPLEFVGSPPVPSIRNFTGYLASTQKVDGSGKVDWVLYEMVLYGMTRALDSIGAQGQILVDRIIWEMLNYLVDRGEIKRSDDPEKFMKSIIDYFLRVGFVSKFEKSFEGSQRDMLVVTYTHSRYHMNVLKRLRDEGSVLYSCPPCIAASTILRKTRGVKRLYAVQYTRKGDDKVVLHHKMYLEPERFTEEEVRRLSQMMDGKK
jgi:hypothetical protein